MEIKSKIPGSKKITSSFALLKLVIKSIEHKGAKIPAPTRSYKEEVWGLPTRTLEGRDSRSVLEKYGFRIIGVEHTFYIVQVPQDVRMEGIAGVSYYKDPVPPEEAEVDIFSGDINILHIHRSSQDVWMSDRGAFQNRHAEGDQNA